MGGDSLSTTIEDMLRSPLIESATSVSDSSSEQGLQSNVEKLLEGWRAVSVSR